MEKCTYKEALQQGLEKLLSQEKVFMFGEDMAEPYGGAYQITKGMSDKYPGKVVNTPMSEQAFTGLGVGMALAGYKPIIEIMFGDFVTLTLDQMLNHASKFQEGFGRNLHLVVRAPMGGYRGYGATHSQSLEKIYLGLPNISVIAPSVLHDPGLLLERSVELGRPVMFIENKLDYTRKMFSSEKISEDFEWSFTEGDFTMCRVHLKGEESPLTIVTYGGMVSPLLTMLHDLYMDEEIAVDVIALSSINPIDYEMLGHLLEGKEHVWTLEEGHAHGGVGDMIISSLVQTGLTAQYHTIAAKESIIGSSKRIEDDVLPNMDRIKKDIIELLS